MGTSGLLLRGWRALLEQVALERVQAKIPKPAVAIQPRPDPAEGRGREPTVMLAADDVAVDQPGALEDHDVLRHRVQRHGKWPGDFGDGGRTPAQSCQNRPPGRIRDRPEDAVERRGFIFNH